MRKWNNILARVILILFLLHALMGSLMLLGISNLSIRPFSWLLLSLHMAFLESFLPFEQLKAANKAENGICKKMLLIGQSDFPVWQF